MNEKISGVLPAVAAKFRAVAPLGDLLTSPSSWVVICGIIVVLTLLLFDGTDVPFIEHLPSVPGLPVVGNLSQLGTEQPRRLSELSKKYGPVFQIRLGNKVSHFTQSAKALWLTWSSGSLLRTASSRSSNFGSTTSLVSYLGLHCTPFIVFSHLRKASPSAPHHGMNPVRDDERLPPPH